MDIELADLLTSLRSEINRARIDAAGEDVRFRVNSIDLEVQVEVEKSGEAGAGVKFWVLSIGGKGSAKSTQTHVVKLSLTAETDTGGPVLTSDEVSSLLAAD
ncbi:trypco2 family protein [Streptomyces sp. NPDC048506]|uniref:trypco2 family protein n=1 Tax=Streptomyces sp. NPDC048506 TaxID=3155028 RepID=UPI00342AA2D3